jgi:hypothetical protein
MVLPIVLYSTIRINDPSIPMISVNDSTRTNMTNGPVQSYGFTFNNDIQCCFVDDCSNQIVRTCAHDMRHAIKALTNLLIFQNETLNVEQRKLIHEQIRSLVSIRIASLYRTVKTRTETN